MNRDEDIDTDRIQYHQNNETMLIMRGDSVKLSEAINTDPEKEPPVRDGDNWRP